MEEGKMESSAKIQPKSNGDTVAMRRPVTTQITNSVTSVQCRITVPKSVLGDARRPISPLMLTQGARGRNSNGECGRQARSLRRGPSTDSNASSGVQLRGPGGPSAAYGDERGASPETTHRFVTNRAVIESMRRPPYIRTRYGPAPTLQVPHDQETNAARQLLRFPKRHECSTSLRYRS